MNQSYEWAEGRTVWAVGWLNLLTERYMQVMNDVRKSQGKVRRTSQKNGGDTKLLLWGMNKISHGEVLHLPTFWTPFPLLPGSYILYSGPLCIATSVLTTAINTWCSLTSQPTPEHNYNLGCHSHGLGSSRDALRTEREDLMEDLYNMKYNLEGQV
jgi:hypothetical protein